MKKTLLNLKMLANRLFTEIAQISADGQGVSRPAFSETETRALEHLKKTAKSNGLAAWKDLAGNYLFSLLEDQDADQFVMVGSHADSVPQGGNYDGLAGVIAGLLCLIQAHQQGFSFKKPVKVVAFRAEESHWFGPCYIGSKSLLGKVTREELDRQHKGDGLTLEHHMRALGIKTEVIRNGQPLINPDSILEYIELHIEQGPILLQKDVPIAVVSGVRGNFRYKKITCHGEAGHSGAVPRAYRRDPVMAFAELLSRLDDSWQTLLQKGHDMVLTSGVVSTPAATHSLSRIPEQLEFSLDCRSLCKTALSNMNDFLNREMRRIESIRKVKFIPDEKLITPPAIMSKNIIDKLTEIMSQSGHEPFVMASGGGHDASIFANADIPTGMIFIRNKNGSHNPDEHMDLADFLMGVHVLFRYLTQNEQRPTTKIF